MYAVETAKMSSKGRLMEESHKNLIGREFRHFKGNHYRLEGFAKDSETLEDQITICIDTGHKTWANIAARKAFTVAFGTADTVKACDYLGIVSGNKAPDKVAKSGLTAVKSAFVDAPVMNELPLVLECELVSMNEETCNVVGKIVNCAVEESALTDGKPDAAKMKPICFDTCAHVYRIMGDVVANAFSCGKELS